MTDAADGRYGYRAWDRRPGDGVDPSVLLTPEAMVEEAKYPTSPPPVDYSLSTREEIAGPRFVGRPRTQPDIMAVLGVGPAPGMMGDDAGFLSTQRPSNG